MSESVPWLLWEPVLPTMDFGLLAYLIKLPKQHTHTQKAKKHFLKVGGHKTCIASWFAFLSNHPTNRKGLVSGKSAPPFG